MDWNGIIGDRRRYAALERRERGGRLLSAAFAALSLLAVVAMLAAAAGPWLALDLRGNVQSAAGRAVAGVSRSARSTGTTARPPTGSTGACWMWTARASWAV